MSASLGKPRPKTKSLNRARYLLFLSTGDGTSFILRSKAAESLPTIKNSDKNAIDQRIEERRTVDREVDCSYSTLDL